MTTIKNILLIVALIFASSICVFAQTNGMKIGAVHPDLKMKITRCEAVGRTVIVDLVYENVGDTDVRLNIRGGFNRSSFAYDDEGNVYGGAQVKVKFGDSDLSDYGASQVMPSGIPIKGRIQIEGVPESSTVLKRIDLRASSEYWAFDKMIKISNVPISREGDE